MIAVPAEGERVAFIIVHILSSYAHRDMPGPLVTKRAKYISDHLD